jgi:glyoxylase-like metal-dependent hydrolase (beta-lactamase superfamily II)
VRDEGAVLVDTGPPNKTAALLQKIRDVPFDVRDLSLIFITHGHWDHIGGLNAVREEAGCPVAMNAREVENVEQEGGLPVKGITLWGRIFARMIGMMESSVSLTLPPVEITTGEEDVPLMKYGIPGTLLHTPGHTAGSTSLLLETGEAFVGDIAMAGFPLRVKPGLPIIGDDIETVKGSYARLLERGATRIFPGHGKPFDASVLERIVAA